MRTLTPKGAKDGFGRLIDLARVEPVIVAKHGRAVVVLEAEGWERLRHVEADQTKPERH
jgi:hypothetical protein